MWSVSPIDSGYSVDNLAPSPPPSLTVAYDLDLGNQLTWCSCPDEDLAQYRVYRGDKDDFEVGEESLVHATSDTAWADEFAGNGKYRYKVTAVDLRGNESEPVIAEVSEIPLVPDRFSLHQSVPNPFNPSTVITYDVPPGGGVVTIRVFDVAGRLVTTLVNEHKPVGRKTVQWHGKNDHGDQVATGVYFYRMQAPGYVKTMKMTLLK